MIVCVCNAINEKELRESVQSGNTRLYQIFKQLGCKQKCHHCAGPAMTIIMSERT